MDKNALLIGNENYPHGIPRITAAQNDIKLMEHKLSILNFNIKKYLDLSKSDIICGVQKLIDSAACDSLNIIYFSGHGFQLGGTNYIVPADFNIKNPSFSSCSLDELISLTRYKEASYIFLIDACRDNIDPSFNKNYGEMQSYPNVFLAYATAFNNVASYIPKDVSFFTKAICNYLLTPNISVQELFVQIRTELYNSYGGQISNTIDCLKSPLIINEIMEKSMNDEKIYDFVERFGEEYNEKYDYHAGEIELFIDASQLFNKGLLDVMYSYDRVSKDRCKMEVLDEARFKWVTFKYLLTIGLQEEKYSWNFRGRKLRLGELPPLPQEMEELTPISGKGLNVDIDIDYNNSRIIARSNLPDGFLLNINISDLIHSQSSIVKNGICKFDFKQAPVKHHEYTVIITSPTVNVMKELDNKDIVGEKGRNLIGKHVEHDEIFGNMIKYSRKIAF